VKVSDRLYITDIVKNRHKAMLADLVRWEGGIKDDKVWVYSDRSKRKEMGSSAWVKIGGEEIVAEELGMRVAADGSIVQMEIRAMTIAVKDMVQYGKRNLNEFTYSVLGILTIDKMRLEECSTRLWDMWADIVTGSWHWTLVQGTQRQEGPKR